ncbi:helix-turn-helix transcriptional regulator [Streptomyces sp. NPDC051642]|uniref:response regulator transcription factor n=1 Tax=unclassified Streptomyces TaxID=2593676 RepID=UPI00342D7FEB
MPPADTGDHHLTHAELTARPVSLRERPAARSSSLMKGTPVRPFATDTLNLLSDRELEVLGHLAEGHTYTSIARRMNLSPHTVDTYLRRIRGKAGVSNRAHLMLLALQATQLHEFGLTQV